MFKKRKVVTLIVAGGKGLRMGKATPKQYLEVGDVPILQRTIERFERNSIIDEIIVVVNKEDLNYVKKEITYGKDKVKKVISGGETRTESVHNGICSIDSEGKSKSPIVLIHDGVRPFASKNMIENCVELTNEHGAAIPVLDLKDTVKQVLKSGNVKNSLDREKYKAVQTPQGFDYNLIKECYEKAIADGLKATDDSSFVEHYGHKVMTYQGFEKNIKITTQLDLQLAEIIARIR